MTDAPTIHDCINEFYKLKNSYEQDYKDKYIVPIIKLTKSFKEKRVFYSRLTKQECINCNRNVGTIFTITYDAEELSRRFIVKCGDLNEPCPLDIQLMYSERTQIDDETNICIDTLRQIKLDIIKQKNNSLFFTSIAYASIAKVKNFETLTDELKQESNYCGSLLENKMLITHNPIKIELLKKNVVEFGTDLLVPFKTMVHEYMTTKNDLIMQNAVKFYVNEMVPKLKIIQDLKYQVNLVEIDIDDGKFKLFQYKNSLQSTEFFYEADDKVISFIKGIKKQPVPIVGGPTTTPTTPTTTTTTTNNNQVNAPNEIKPKTKPKKIKHTLVLVDEPTHIPEE